MLKTALTSLLVIALAASAKADCAGTGLYAFPTTQTLPQNARIVLTGYAESQNVIAGLNKKHAVYLRCNNQRINLIVHEMCVGEFWLTQALLIPEKTPQSGLVYELVIDSLPAYENLSRYNSTTHKDEPITYQFSATTDRNSPVLKGQPKEKEKTLVHYGCGPSTHVSFTCPVTDASPVLARTTVKNATTGKTTTYYLEVIDGIVSIGHDMCSGAFSLKEGPNFEVTFSFVDLCGNETKATAPIRFTEPVPTGR